MSSLPVLNTMLNLKMAGNIAAASAPNTTEYRALVCLFFSGGMDSFNVLVPRSSAEYEEYKTVRGTLALAKNSLLPLTPTLSPGVDLGLHPALTNLKTLFDGGKAAFVSNVGTLLEPVTKTQFDDGGGRFPLGLFSHSDQVEQWQTGTSDIRSPRGWGGKAADVLRSLNNTQTVSMNMSMSGGNVWQSGEEIFAYSIDPYQGAVSLDGYDPSNDDASSITAIRTRAVDRQLALDYQHLLTQEFASRKRSAIDTYQLFNAATDHDLPAGSNFNRDNNYLGAQLERVAKAIAAHSALGHTRQTFYVEIGGWDMHSKLIAGQNESLPPVSEAILAFDNCMKALNLHNNVTTFTASDFGRTLSSNGDGTDHAWGGNQFVFGGAVNGNHIYGQYPSLVEGGPLDVGRGRFIPSTPVDVYFAELALWLGVPKSELATVLPNISGFYDPMSSSSPMGF
ncbi:MAG: hypothetical protein JWO89_103, partial [Verrucomicrobiaceae bacterium]|nr:hypothetical protein [Verrucomicrobiaceae bacterium]